MLFVLFYCISMTSLYMLCDIHAGQKKANISLWGFNANTLQIDVLVYLREERAGL